MRIEERATHCEDEGAVHFFLIFVWSWRHGGHAAAGGHLAKTSGGEWKHVGIFFLSFVFFFTTLGSSMYALTSKANFSIFCGKNFELLDCIFLLGRSFIDVLGKAMAAAHVRQVEHV